MENDLCHPYFFLNIQLTINKHPKIIVSIVCYNSDNSTKETLSKIPIERSYDILIINDGSIDKTKEYIKESAFKSIHHEVNKGLGAAIKTGIKYALDNGYEVFVIMAGNNKDDPREIPRLVKPIIEDDIDYIQGSRFLEGGRFENPPFFRHILVKLYVLLFKLMTGFKGTDAINGFRAYKLDILKDQRINIWQDWLDGYGYETYLYYKVLKLGYKIKEVPVSKTYPENKKNVKYSHIKPFISWWDIVKPLFYLKLGIKQ